jgi:hypothetical protein
MFQPFSRRGIDDGADIGRDHRRASEIAATAGPAPSRVREDFLNSGAMSNKINGLAVNLGSVAGNFFSLPSAWQGISREMQNKNDIIDSMACF